MRKLLLDVLDDAASDLTVGERIAKARREAGLKQDELADLVGVKPRQIQNYEAGTSDPYRKINQLAKALGRSVEWLRDGVTPQPEVGDAEWRERIEARLDAILRHLGVDEH